MKLFFLAIAMVVIFGMLLINSTVDNAASSEQTPQVLAASTVADPMLDAINAFRLQNGLQSLQISPELLQLTMSRASDMVAHHYYSHRSPAGISYVDQIKDYLPGSVSSCENLQLQNSEDINQAVLAWSKSLPHKECLLNPKLQVGAVTSAYFDDVSSTTDDSAASYVFVFIGSN